MLNMKIHFMINLKHNLIFGINSIICSIFYFPNTLQICVLHVDPCQFGLFIAFIHSTIGYFNNN